VTNEATWSLFAVVYMSVNAPLTPRPVKPVVVLLRVPIILTLKIIVRLPLLNHSNKWTTRDISNNVDSTGVLRVAGAATTDVSSCSVY
jgi:hypothetical protein